MNGKKEGSESVTKCNRLKMVAADGKIEKSGRKGKKDYEK